MLNNACFYVGIPALKQAQLFFFLRKLLGFINLPHAMLQLAAALTSFRILNFPGIMQSRLFFRQFNFCLA